ncbi:alpha/beta fold hydrolase [Sulfuricaulis sp.]|jgi:pimeloyl-ACP methyl ester carboxylesterase|uniref:alpha/beta fold hydrolase n=1 Tax=Sulfuricaulis sp. TaxID=2003553 RepID=UPI003559F5CF
MEVIRNLTTADGATLGYHLFRGAAAPRRLIVLLHGVASNMSRWSEFVEHTSLKESWDLLRPDLRGHGESFARGRLGLEIWCRDLRDILDAEGYDQALLIGHSLGAQVAVQFAARYPARVRGLVLIDPIFHQALRGGMRVLSWLRPAISLLAVLVHLPSRLGLRRRHIPVRNLRKLDEKTRQDLLAAGKQKEMIELYSSPWEDLKFFPLASFLQELIEISRPLPALAEIKVPILALLSSGITYTDPGITQKMLAGNAQVRTVMVDAYHWPLTEKPRQVREAIEKWCERFPL